MENADQPAFPSIGYEQLPNGQMLFSSTGGMTKREMIAAMAMQGLLANPERYKYISGKVDSGMSQDEASQKNAHKAVLIADALLAELEKNN